MFLLGSISAVSMVRSWSYPKRDPSGGWVRAHFPEQRLVIEPMCLLVSNFKMIGILIYYLDFYFSCISVRVRVQFSFGCVHYLFIQVACTFSSFNNVLVLLCAIFLTYMCCPRLCSHGWWLLRKCSAIGIGFNAAKTNRGIARILGILLMNS